jgi:hypothetical protein
MSVSFEMRLQIISDSSDNIVNTVSSRNGVVYGCCLSSPVIYLERLVEAVVTVACTDQYVCIFSTTIGFQ